MSNEKNIAPNEASPTGNQPGSETANQDAKKAQDVDETNRAKYDDGKPEKDPPAPSEAGQA